MVDAVGYVTILAIIALVSWLTNREISRSLARLRTSEAELAWERDSLEVKVAERTRELQEAQLLRSAELQRFAEFGRLSAGLLHEVTNPLTAVSLNLEQLGNHKSELIAQARGSLQQLERYIEAARKQVKQRSDQTMFSVRKELDQVACVMLPLTRRAHIALVIGPRVAGRVYGDPVKFNQVVANLIANAIDAYSEDYGQHQPRSIQVSTVIQRQSLQLSVRDWGKGISDAELPHLFEPFYTTKAASERNLGMGLAMIKRIVEENFGGTIVVQSTPGRGTSFLITFQTASPPLTKVNRGQLGAVSEKSPV